MKTISLKQLRKIALAVAACAVMSYGLGSVRQTRHSAPSHAAVRYIQIADGVESHGGKKGS